MKKYCLTMEESDIVIGSQYGEMFMPDIVFDGPSLQFVPNTEKKMYVGIEFMKGLYSVELCTIGDALTIKNIPDRIDLDCIVVKQG